MLILPTGHARAVQSRRTLSTRERWMIGGVLGMVVALVLGVVIALATGGPSSRHGCVYATIPGPVGAEQISRCGAEARALCRSIGTAGSYTGDSGRAIASECRKAGLPVGP